METPLFPWLPMLAISTGLVNHAYALTSLFPYVGYMVQYLGITDDKDEVGFYAGYLGSAFMVGRFGSSYFWGRFADRYGRLPVFYIGLCSIALCSVGFGLSTSFYWAITFRFLLGAMNGLIAIAKTMIPEVCGKEHEVVGMSFVTGSWSIGLVFGPGLGGLLAEPAKHYPNVFSESGLFGRFPYLLPNLVGASLALIGLAMVFFFLKETRHLHNGSEGGEFQAVRTAEETTDGSKFRPDGLRIAEEGKLVEMVPMTQASSLDDDGDDGFQEQEDTKAPEASWGQRGFEKPVGSGGGSGSGGGGGGVPVIRDEPVGGVTGRDETIGGGGIMAVGCSNVTGEESRLREARLPNEALREETPHVERGSRSKSSKNGNGVRTSGGKELSGSSAGGSKGVGAESRDGLEGRCGKACWREFLLPMKLFRDKKVRAILFVYGIFSFLNIGAQEVYPLWALSTQSKGGLDWTTKQIGQALSFCGVGMVVFQFLIYPKLVKRIGVKTSQRWACTLLVPTFLVFPFLSNLHDSERALLVASLVLLFAINATTGVIFINVALATNNAVDPSRRGTLNGISMTLGSLAKAAGPTAFGNLFAWSINRPRSFPFDYHLVFYVLALGMTVMVATSWDAISHDSVEGKGYASDASATRTTTRSVREGLREDKDEADGVVEGEDARLIPPSGVVA